ncbi:N-acetylneuraminate synthase family protein [bacterium]|nr:N-acetylneuraminate synthase family protein [bacterium]MCP5462926.1 N-acetylneuraminate synthase family protein [bacterium]
MNAKTFIIAEAGSNWRMGHYRRDLKMAFTLIDAAVDAQADAIKFQTYRPETVYVPNAGESDYLSESGITESIYDIFKDLSMPYEMIPELAAYCKKNGIQFMSTPFSINDAQAIDPFVSIHKIASYEITHMRLIEYIAQTAKPLILSTGASTPKDIQWAVDFFYSVGGKELSLMHCIAKYPAPLESLNLRVIPAMIKQFEVPIGFSDHSRDPIIGPITAVSLGASIIEKHFTLHNALPGPDHSFAITAEELKLMIKSIRETELTLGCCTKNIFNVELELYEYAQRGIQAIKPIQPGDVLQENLNISILRPGKQKKGIHPRHLFEIEGKKASRTIAAGEGIQKNDYA